MSVLKCALSSCVAGSDTRLQTLENSQRQVSSRILGSLDQLFQSYMQQTIQLEQSFKAYATVKNTAPSEHRSLITVSTEAQPRLAESTNALLTTNGPRCERAQQSEPLVL